MALVVRDRIAVDRDGDGAVDKGCVPGHDRCPTNGVIQLAVIAPPA